MTDISLSNSARDLWEKDRAHLMHPWSNLAAAKDEGSLIIAKGSGVHIEDAEGKRYLDAVGGLWCTNIGLGRNEMAEAIAEQVRTLAYCNPFVDIGSAPAAELAARIAQVAPGSINRVIFTTGGSSANETAFRIINFYNRTRGKPEKRHILVRRQSYHGSTLLTSSLTGKDQIPEFEYLRDFIHFLSAPNPYRAPDGMDEAAFGDYLIDEFQAKIDDIGAENVAAFFAEPIQGAGGVIVAPEGYLKRAWEICRKNDILFVADEVVTGFGRLGHWFASLSEFGIQPDIIASAKGLTAGYLPLGACLYTDELHEAMLQGSLEGFFGHGYTYGAHPVSCVAGLKVMEILEREAIFDHVNDVGPYFMKRLHSLDGLPIVGNVRGKKLMGGVEFVQNRATKALFPEELNIGKQVANKAEALGLMVRPIVHLNIMSPALTISRDEIDFVVDTLGASIKAVADDLVRDGVKVD
jgi:putrescine---pyruvate transaminase